MQSEIKRRQPDRRQLNNNSIFAARIICGECGGYYGSKVWQSNNRYRYTGWRCNRKYDSGVRCNTPRIREEWLKQAFVKAFNQILGDKDRYIAQFEELLPMLADVSSLEGKLAEAQDAHDAAVGRMRRFIEENARQIQDQEEYERHWDKMNSECEDAESTVSRIKDDILEQSARKEKICRYLEELKRTGGIVSGFDDGLWQATVESVTVYPDRSLNFTFRDGTQIPVKDAGHSSAGE